MKHLHLPHPHIAERVAGVFDRALHHHPTPETDLEVTQPLTFRDWTDWLPLHKWLDRQPARPPVVPDGHDWNEWHWYEGEER